MKADRRSRAFLILTIALSVCMACSVILISAGAQEEFKNTQRNKAQIAMIGITDGQLSALRQSKDVQWAGEYAAIGLFYSGNETVTVAYGSEDYFTHQEEKSIQGRAPQTADEIMLPQNYIDFLGASYRPGDTVTLDMTGAVRSGIQLPIPLLTGGVARAGSCRQLCRLLPAGRDEPLHHAEAAVAVSRGAHCRDDSHLLNIHGLCRGRIEENGHTFRHTRRIKKQRNGAFCRSAAVGGEVIPASRRSTR